MLSRITQLVDGFTYTARNTSGVVRTLVEGGELFDGDQITVRAPEVQWGAAACVVQKRVASQWLDSVSITLSVEDGSSHWSTTWVCISGTDVDSIVSTFVSMCGDRLITVQWREQVRRQASCGTPFMIGSQSFVGIRAPLRTTGDFDRGGIAEKFGLSITCDRKQIEDSIPSIGDTVIVSGASYVLDSIDPGDAVVLLNIVSA